MTTLHDALRERKAITEAADDSPWKIVGENPTPTLRHIANCDPATVTLLLDVALAAAMRQQAIQLLNDSATGAEAMGFYCDRALEHERTMDAALEALREHLCGGEDGA